MGDGSTAPPTASTSPASEALSPFLFPSTWKASFSHWWGSSSADGYRAQKSLVERGLDGTGIVLKDYDTVADGRTSPLASTSDVGNGVTPSSQRVAKLRKIDLGGGSDRILNVLEVGTEERRKNEQTVVVVHGYGGAFGFYWQNLRSLCSDRFPNTRVYFLDMLGMGLSGRPKFPSIKVKGDPLTPANVQSRVEQAETFFLDSFEQFARKEKLSNFTMMGHSLGGYLSTAYALKYPERVSKLVLLSPVGIPRSPYMDDEEEEAKMGDARADLDREPEQAGSESSKTTPTTRMTSASSSGTSTPNPASASAAKSRPTPPSNWWTKAWELNISPFSVVRLSTFAGPKLVSRYAQRRFGLFDAPVQGELFSYLYSVYGQKGSGEYCLSHILSPGAYARWPLIGRMSKLDPKIPVSFVYGDSDWMDSKAGREAAEMLRNRPKVSQTVKERTKVYINQDAGHWLFLTNVDGMNKIFDTFMEDTLRDHPVA